MYTRLAAAALAASTLLSVAGIAQGQEKYPAKVIRIVTAAPGSNHDWGARITAQELAPRIGQKVIVENKRQHRDRVRREGRAARRLYAAFLRRLRLAAALSGQGQLGSGRRLRADHAGDYLTQRPGRASLAAGEDRQGNDRARARPARAVELRRRRRRLDAAHRRRALQVHGACGHRARPLQGHRPVHDRTPHRGSAAHVQRARARPCRTSSRAG